MDKPRRAVMKAISWGKTTIEKMLGQRNPGGRQRDRLERGMLTNLGFGLRQTWVQIPFCHL